MSLPATKVRRFPLTLAVGILAVICYANVPLNDYAFDGKLVVQNNDLVTAPGQGLNLWTKDLWYASRDQNPRRDLLYRPITLSSYRLVRIVAGPAPGPQHVVNVLLHALICVLVVRLARQVGADATGAGIAGVFFALLPIHTDVVANMVGRADLLATLGILLTLECHQRGTQPYHAVQTSRLGRWAWTLGAAACAFMALGAKENGVAVVLIVPLLDLLAHRQQTGDSQRRRWLRLEVLLRLGYLVLPVLLYFALRYHALDGQLFQRPALTKTVNVLVDAPTWQHALGVVQLWGMYWAKTFWPAELCIEYSINAVRLATALFDGYVLLGLGVAVILGFASVRAWRRGQPRTALIVLTLLAAYLPTANAFLLIQVFFAERIWYLPSVWLALLVGLALAPHLRRPAWILTVSLIAFAALGRCWLRNAEWRDNGTLFAAAYHDHPESVSARHLYGQWLAYHGEYERGVALLERALELDLGLTDAHRVLGRVHLEAGDVSRALHHLRTANMQVPNHRATEEALERARKAQPAAQLAQLRRQAELEPDDLQTQSAYVEALLELARTDEALAHLAEADARFLADASWLALNARVLLYAGDLNGAIERYRQACELAPTEPQHAVELAMLLLERRAESASATPPAASDIDEAEAWLLRARTAAPDNPQVLVGLAELHALRGDLARALELYEDALRRVPADSPQRRIWEARAQTLGR